MRAFVLVIAVGLCVAGCGGDDTSGSSAPESSATPQTTQRGVATVFAELAPLCVDKLTEPGPASPEIEALVDDMVAAYKSGPKNTATRGRMQQTVKNLRNGCGPDQAAKVQAALQEG